MCITRFITQLKIIFEWSSYIPLTNRARDLYSKLRTAFFPLGFIARAKKKRVRYLYLWTLGSSRGERFHSKETFEFSGPYSEIRPTKLTKQTTRTPSPRKQKKSGNYTITSHNLTIFLIMTSLGPSCLLTETI